MFIILALLCSISSLLSNDKIGREAVFIRPVTDLCCTLPLVNSATPASFKGNANTCVRRAYQALFNEFATVVGIDQEQNAVQLEFAHLIYGYDTNKKPLNRLWAPLAAVKILPHVFTKDDMDLVASLPSADEPCIILTKPLARAGLVYSVATRLRVTSYDLIGCVYTARLYDHTSGTHSSIGLPDDHAIAFSKLSNELSPGQHLLDAARRLIKVAKPGVVPFVWGGASFCEERTKTPTSNATSWDFEHNGLYGSYDASSLIYRCAEMAHVYFPWKTTTAAFDGAPELARDVPFSNGDIICYKGFEGIIASRTTIIRMRGYDNNGSGALEEVPLRSVFKRIYNIDDLHRCYIHSVPLMMTIKDGDIVIEDKDILAWKIIRPTKKVLYSVTH